MPFWLSGNHQEQHLIEQHLKLQFYSPVYPGLSFCQFFDSKGNITPGIRKIWCLKLKDSGTISKWPLAFHIGWPKSITTETLPHHNIFEHVSSLPWMLFSLSVKESLGLRAELIHRNSPPWFALLNSFEFSKHWKRSHRPCIFLNASLTLHCPNYLDNWDFMHSYLCLRNRKRGNECCIRKGDYLLTLWLRQKGNSTFRKVELY